MSLILEALRKSEAERRRGLAPDVAMELPPTPADRPRPLAAWLLPALVVAALLVLAGWWARREPAAGPTPAAAIEATTDMAQDAISPGPSVTPRIEPKPAAPAVASASAAEIEAPADATPASVRDTQAPPMPASTAAPTSALATARPAPTQPLPNQPTPARPAPARPLPPPVSEISNDTSMLPPIKLSMLMWDEVPSRRFVILNGQRMAEGDRYGGIGVVTIERNGVVVEGNGAKARVPLP